MRFTLASLLLGSTLVSAAAFAQETPITLNFAAQVGAETFRCGGSYADIGTTKSTVTPSDFRFYVSDVALIRADGTEQPVVLTQDQKWVYSKFYLHFLVFFGFYPHRVPTSRTSLYH
jgi:hypothetical protein